MRALEGEQRSGREALVGKAALIASVGGQRGYADWDRLAALGLGGEPRPTTAVTTRPHRPGHRPRPGRSAHPAHPGSITTGAGALAAAATVGALVAGGTPAYALTTHPDGTLTLAVHQASGIAEANIKLHQLGDNVVVVPVRAGCPDISSLRAPAVSPEGHLSSQGSENLTDGSVTVNVQGVPAVGIVVVAAQATTQGSEMTTRLTSPPAPGCVILPAIPARN